MRLLWYGPWSNDVDRKKNIVGYEITLVLTLE